MDLNSYILIWICILGLCLGSFFNVVILRSLSGESIVFPGSKCPKCGEKLKPWHNIPVLSYLFLGGKCAFCRDKISIQYPLIELITMGLFVISYIKFGITWECLFAIFLSSSLIIMSSTDIKEKLVDCNIAIFIAILGILYNWLVNNSLLDSILGLLVGIIFMEILAFTGHLLKKGRAFGEADTYVAGALGACFGLKYLPEVFLYTLIASMFFIIPSFLYSQFKNNNKSVCILFILFILSALIHRTLFQNLYTVLALLVLGIALVVMILKKLRTESSSLYLPLVPAFALGALYFLFF